MFGAPEPKSYAASAELREVFERSYPAELRERNAVLFDLFDADDARLYTRS